MATSETESDGELEQYSDSHSDQSVSSEDNPEMEKGKRGSTRLPKLLKNNNGDRLKAFTRRK
ncbi:hypothetical protein MKW94_004035 [Papaver nudicaule]|uniref:Uncharacterized protein n=1 Tax=Papaver nudicaule TaxID=74823 RepID=A0AA41SD05_PAPNU|nr:hypothetical protein [Papaver nudicaule]